MPGAFAISEREEDVARREIEPQSMAKHCNEALILAILSGGEKHGYQLALEIESRSGGFFTFNHGTLYPILHKLEKEGLIKGKWKREGPKRKRKIYVLTPQGRRHAAWQRDAWRRFCDSFFEIVEERET